MEVVHWFRGLLPIAALALVGAAAPAHPPATGTAGSPWEPSPCVGVPAPGNPGATATPAWFRLDPVLDRTGTLAGRHLTLGVLDGAVRRLDLPPESFASGPVRGRVLAGDDDGSRSRLRVIDVVQGCAATVAVERAVVRTGVLSADLATVWEHRVDRRTRADLGVWQRSLNGGPAVRVLAGLAADARHGPTFTTELLPSPDGRLVVASCGELACRTRVLDPASSRVDTVEGTGPALGLAGGRVVAYAPCHGLPCPILGIDPANGRDTTLVNAAGLAAMGGAGGGMLLYEVPDHGLAVLDLGSGRHGTPFDAEGWLPIRRGSGATSGADTAPGALVLAPGGRIGRADATRTLDPVAALDPATISIHALGEVAR